MIALSMKKIRINELARELEIKAHELIDRLPELGVTEKKTHSSSIDEDVAIRLRRLYGFDVPDYVPGSEDHQAEMHEEHTEDDAGEAPVAQPASAPKPPLGPSAIAVKPDETPTPVEERQVVAEPPRTGLAAPIRPPLAGRPIHPPVAGVPVRPEIPKHVGPRAAPAP